MVSSTRSRQRSTTLSLLATPTASPGWSATATATSASAHGLTEVGTDSAIRTDSVFRASSMTRAVGTVAAMQLIEQGRRDLDTPVADILPDLATIQVLVLKQSGHPSRQMTVT